MNEGHLPMAGAPAVGAVAMATAGRDKGNFYVIFRMLDGGYALVVDGGKRPVARPKRKNLRHLKVVAQADEHIARSILASDGSVDIAVRAVIKRIAPGEPREEGP